jgi:hypothetical protein
MRNNDILYIQYIIFVISIFVNFILLIYTNIAWDEIAIIELMVKIV